MARLLVTKGAGPELVDALVFALAAYGMELRPAEPPWTMTAPAGVMRVLGGRAFSSFVGEATLYRVGEGLQLNLNPNELLLRGKPDLVLRAQTLAQEVIAPRAALMTTDARARDLERQIKRVWSVYAEDPADHREAPILLKRSQV